MSEPEPARRVARPWLLAVPALAAIAAAAIAGYELRGRPAAADAPAVPVATAAVVRTGVQATERLDGTLGYGPAVAIAAPAAGGAPAAGIVTSLPAQGQVIAQGQALYGIDGQPVILLSGAVPDWRPLVPGVTGDDVRQLERDLLALGFATPATLAVDGVYTAADAAAVLRWQAALGVPRTGVVALGAVAFAAAPVRVVDVHASLGATPGGGPILDVSATQHVITVQVPVQDQQRVHVGDAVSVLMPDGATTVAGTVTTVGRVAVTPAPPDQGGQGGPPLPAIEVDVRLADEAAAGGLDQAPVFVTITTAVHGGVLAVPITALQAQPDGSYAVAVRTGAQRRLVTVQPGLFDSRGLVEVAGPGLAAGDRVEVPAQ